MKKVIKSSTSEIADKKIRTSSDYTYLKSITEGHDLPCTATNNEGDTVIIEKGRTEGEEFFRLETYQKNNWVRINEYYEDGTVTESYER